jgi:hypothetical protein
MATHKKQFFKRHNVKEDSLSLKEISKISGVSLADLKEVYNRGIGAYKTNPQSVRMKGTFKKNVKAPMNMKLSKEQWGMARCYAFVNKLDRIKEGKQSRINQDCSIAKKYYKSVKCDVK